ncbi:unnamed protein product [Prunus armeniaca]
MGNCMTILPPLRKWIGTWIPPLEQFQHPPRARASAGGESLKRTSSKEGWPGQSGVHVPGLARRRREREYPAYVIADASVTSARDCASSNVVWCYWTREKKFQPYPMWEVVKHCKRFSIIPTAPTVVLNEMPLHDSQAADSPMESPMSEDSPIQKEPRPIGRKASKAKRGINSTSNTSKFLEEIARQSALRIEIDKKVQEDDRAMAIEFAKEREYVRKEREYQHKENEEKKDRETMAMDTSHMSPETKQYWKLERKAIMRRRLFRDDGPSNTDWLNDENP